MLEFGSTQTELGGEMRMLKSAHSSGHFLARCNGSPPGAKLPDPFLLPKVADFPSQFPKERV